MILALVRWGWPQFFEIILTLHLHYVPRALLFFFSIFEYGNIRKSACRNVIATGRVCRPISYTRDTFIYFFMYRLNPVHVHRTKIAIIKYYWLSLSPYHRSKHSYTSTHFAKSPGGLISKRYSEISIICLLYCFTELLVKQFYYWLTSSISFRTLSSRSSHSVAEFIWTVYTAYS